MPSQSELRMLGDTLEPSCVICYLRDEPYDWTGKTASFVLEKQDGTAITEAGTIQTHPTQTVTFDSTNNWIWCPRHGIKRGNNLIFATGGSLSGVGLSAATPYVAVEVDTNWFRVSLSSNGGPITIGGAGTGTHTVYVIGSVQITYATADINAAVPYKLWIVSTSATKTLTFPSTRDGIAVNIEPFGN